MGIAGKLCLRSSARAESPALRRGRTLIADCSLEMGIAEVETRVVSRKGWSKLLERLEKKRSRRLHCWGKFVGPYSGRSGTNNAKAKQSLSPNRNISDHLRIGAT
jgi:hypothetical protein